MRRRAFAGMASVRVWCGWSGGDLRMSHSNDDGPPVVEAGAPPAADLSLRALQMRVRQQEILATLGVTALQGASFDELLETTARMVAEGLRAEFSKVLEYMPEENRFLVRAGVGWQDGVVGVATLGADLASPAGYALTTGRPVISNHLENEERFRTPEVLRQHGIHRAMNVILRGDGRPFGVLEVDSRSDDEFVEYDLAFLEGAANLLGMAIEHERQERHIKAALDRHEVLLKEMNHRVKNSLAIVSSMLQIQAADVGDEVLTGHLTEAARRVASIAKVHDHLAYSSDIERMDIGGYIDTVCRDLADSVPQCVIHAQTQPGIVVRVERAVSMALIVNELIANAAKYAEPDRTGCRIWLTLAAGPQDDLVMSVRDEGIGLPAGFDLARPRGLGMRMIVGLVKQLGGALSVHDQDPGTEFVITVPR